ncbi:putative gustatory receptor 28a isoform X2 [Helicoverpa zea]|uniref:putative gustatory receptor 28a isoform X2 n=1 Tax=Helicoverpa zea TaxID=7113 RepID=UPI001F5A7F2D|nr:putative gustatory receptor 28a isoform X2 [Helicoverpa zea]
MLVTIKKKPFNILGKNNNIIEALSRTNFFRRFSGISVFTLKLSADNRVIRGFSKFGFTCFLTWLSLYIYCTYRAHAEDQTVLRVLFSTKVQRYGDDYERISSTIYVIFAFWKIPFRLNINNGFMGMVVKVDKALEELGATVNYNFDALLALSMSISQTSLCVTRLLSVWLTLRHLGVPVPSEKMFQVILSDSLALIATAHYSFFLTVLRSRFRHMNKILQDIKNHKSWEHKLFIRGSMFSNPQKAVSLQDKFICEKIKACANIHAMLYKMTDLINKVFGSILMVTILIYQTYTVWFMFSFMEATAAGLFHDVERYVVFCINVFWEIGYATFITFMVIYVSERAVYESQQTPFILHQIMYSDFSPEVKAEAMQLSIQCMHQKLVFTAFGLYELNYATLHNLCRSVCTYLIILLQFVTDAKAIDMNETTQ